MQTMLRMIGFGDNAGSEFPTILDTWEKEGWVKPELIEDTNLNQVTIMMRMAEKSAEKLAEKSTDSTLQIRQQQILACMDENVGYSTDQIAEAIGLKKSRTRQLLNKLVDMKLLTYTGATKNRRYIKT